MLMLMLLQAQFSLGILVQGHQATADTNGLLLLPLLLLQAQFSPGILVQAIEKVKSLGVAYFTAGKLGFTSSSLAASSLGFGLDLKSAGH
jgi:hypothetical protein